MTIDDDTRAVLDVIVKACYQKPTTGPSQFNLPRSVLEAIKAMPRDVLLRALGMVVCLDAANVNHFVDHWVER
jgi:hypothetical protein